MPEILDPPERLPADVRPGVPLDQLRGAATWAERFQPSDAGFAQRFRHNRDIREYGEALQAKQAAAIEREAQTNAQAQGFFFRSRELDLKRKEQEQDMRFKDELHPLAMEAKQAATDASRALEFARTKAAKDGAVRTQLAAAKMARASEHSRGFEEHMHELEGRGVTPDHPEYRDGFEIGRKTFPWAEKEVIDGYKAALPSVPDEMTPLQKHNVEQEQVQAGAAVNKQIETLKEKRAKAEQDREPKMVSFYDARIAETERGLKPVATVPVAPLPADKPKQVRQNGVIFTLQPDGSYK